MIATGASIGISQWCSADGWPDNQGRSEVAAGARSGCSLWLRSGACEFEGVAFSGDLLDWGALLDWLFAGFDLALLLTFVLDLPVAPLLAVAPPDGLNLRATEFMQ